MAVKRSQNWLNQQRVDVPHLRSIESAVRNDFDELFATFVMGESQSLVVRGFELEMTGAIGASANGLQMIVEDSAMLHGASNESGTFFEIPVGELNQVLSSTTNPRVEGAFTPSALNYISIEFAREIDDSTTSQLFLWNPTTQSEITRTVPLAETLDYRIVISSSIFAPNTLPIAIVETDVANAVLSVEDRRPMLFRLGTAGFESPDPFAEFEYDTHVEGRFENPSISSTSTISPFRGGDKQIRNLKENDEALKTEIRQIKGTTKWFSPNTAGSIVNLRYDLGNTLLTGRGYIEHNNGSPGQVNWNEDIFLTVVSTRLRYNIEANPTGVAISLADNQAAFVRLNRGTEVAPRLIFTNGADEVTSVGGIAWTADLEVGDYVKVAAEGDEAYFQIASIDSISQVTLTENFTGASTGATGTGAQTAFGNYRVGATPASGRAIEVANINDVPFEADVYWLMLRSDSGGQARIYLRFLNAELEVGEQLQISDQVPAALLAFVGSASDSDADPAYGVVALGALLDTSNYNTVDGENLTVRISQLTSMVADKAQDKTIQLVSNHTRVTNTQNTTDTALQDIAFSGGTGTATITLPTSDNNNTISLTSSVSIGENQVAYYSIDRNAASALADLNGLTVANIADVPLTENIFVFAYRLLGTTVYLWNNDVIEEGDFISLSVLRDQVQQNKTAKLIAGGTWSWDLVATELTLSQNAYIQIAGLDNNVNEINAQSITLTNSGDVAYVSVKRDTGASVLTVSTAANSAIELTDDIFVIARRVGDEVIVGTNSFTLQNRDFLTLDGTKAEIDRRLDQLRIEPAQPISTRVIISPSDIVQLNGSRISLEQSNLLLEFAGAQIDFNTGEVFEADGSTPLAGGLSDFTPFTVPANEFFFYSVAIVPGDNNTNGTVSGRITITPSTASNAVLADAIRSAFISGGVNLGNVYVQRNAADTSIEVINFENITNLNGDSSNVEENNFNDKSIYGVFDAEDQVLTDFVNFSIENTDIINESFSYSISTFPANTPEVTINPRSQSVTGFTNSVEFHYSLTSGSTTAQIKDQLGNILASSVLSPATATLRTITFLVDNTVTGITLEFLDSGTSVGLIVDDIIFSDRPQAFRTQTAIITDSKPSGTNGGTFVSGDWRTRDLNTIDSKSDLTVGLTANQIVLQPGRYLIEASAMARGVRLNKIRFQNISTNDTEILGLSHDCDNEGSFFDQGEAELSGIVDITTTSFFELQHRCSLTQNVFGFGFAAVLGVDEIYSIVKITKVA